MSPTPELLVSGLVALSIYEKQHLKGLPAPLAVVLRLPRNTKNQAGHTDRQSFIVVRKCSVRNSIVRNIKTFSVKLSWYHENAPDEEHRGSINRKSAVILGMYLFP